MSEITAWVAGDEYLEVRVRIDPWKKYGSYTKEYKKVGSSYYSIWTWMEGSRDNSSRFFTNDDVAEILDNLVRNHSVLKLFCGTYGIEELDD